MSCAELTAFHGVYVLEQVAHTAQCVDADNFLNLAAVDQVDLSSPTTVS